MLGVDVERQVMHIPPYDCWVGCCQVHVIYFIRCDLGLGCGFAVFWAQKYSWECDFWLCLASSGEMSEDVPWDTNFKNIMVHIVLQ